MSIIALLSVFSLFICKLSFNLSFFSLLYVLLSFLITQPDTANVLQRAEARDFPQFIFQLFFCVSLNWISSPTSNCFLSFYARGSRSSALFLISRDFFFNCNFSEPAEKKLSQIFHFCHKSTALIFHPEIVKNNFSVFFFFRVTQQNREPSRRTELVCMVEMLCLDALDRKQELGWPPDTFLMHTYKIYFRFYLLLLPLSLALVQHENEFLP